MGCSTSSPKVEIKPPTELETNALHAYNLRVKSYTHYAYNVPQNIYMAWCIAKYNEDIISIEHYNENMKLPEDSIGLCKHINDNINNNNKNNKINNTTHIRHPDPTLGDLDKLTLI
jgi:hypothetical protein